MNYLFINTNVLIFFTFVFISNGNFQTCVNFDSEVIIYVFVEELFVSRCIIKFWLHNRNFMPYKQKNIIFNF